MSEEQEFSQRVRVVMSLARTAKDDRLQRIVIENMQALSNLEKDQLKFGCIGGYSVISDAARRGDQFLYEILVACCDLEHDHPDLQYGMTPLHHAAECGKTKMVCTLVEKHVYALDALDKSNSTPLCLAIMNGNVHTAKALIRHGADLRVENIYGTLLHNAAFRLNDDLDVVKLMCEKCPEAINLEVQGFCTPIIAAMCRGSINYVSHLAEVSNDLSKSALAYKALVCYNKEEDAKSCLDILLRNGMNPDIYDETIHEEEPILLAARLKWKKIVEMLLPVSSMIDNVKSWSVDSLLNYVSSKKFKLMESKRKDARHVYLHNKCIEELKNRNFLAAYYFHMALRLDMLPYDYFNLQCLISTMMRFARIGLKCNDEDIRAIGMDQLQLGNWDVCLDAARACLSLNPGNKENKQFLEYVQFRYSGPQEYLLSRCSG